MHEQEPQTEPAHDVLRAEAFEVPAVDPDLHDLHEPVAVPEDPSGIKEPHDVLAAEEFPMPGLHQPPPSTSLVRHARSRKGMAQMAAGFMLAFMLARLLRRRGR